MALKCSQSTWNFLYLQSSTSAVKCQCRRLGTGTTCFLIGCYDTIVSDMAPKPLGLLLGDFFGGVSIIPNSPFLTSNKSENTFALFFFQILFQKHKNIHILGRKETFTFSSDGV